MLNKYYNGFFFLVIGSLFLSACGSLSISQKRYSNGLNINWFGSKDDKSLTSQPSTKRKSMKLKVNTPTILNNDSDILTTVSIQIDSLKNSDMTPLTTELNESKLVVKKNLRKKLIYNFSKSLHTQSTQLSEKVSVPTAKNDTHESGGLKFIGWFLIILGLIFLLVINIVVGLLFMLLGLLFVVAGS